MNSKLALERLRRKIIHDLNVERWREAWFYEEDKKLGISGWQGTGRVMFIGLNPSTGKFPSKADELFYRSLEKNGFHNAHLTDLFKARATSEKMDADYHDLELKKLCQQYLREEISILRPQLMVALGDKAFKILKEWFKEEEFRKIHHYSWAKRRGKEHVFRKDMADIRKRAGT